MSNPSWNEVIRWRYSKDGSPWIRIITDQSIDTLGLDYSFDGRPWHGLKISSSSSSYSSSFSSSSLSCSCSSSSSFISQSSCSSSESSDGYQFYDVLFPDGDNQEFLLEIDDGSLNSPIDIVSNSLHVLEVIRSTYVGVPLDSLFLNALCEEWPEDVGEEINVAWVV